MDPVKIAALNRWLASQGAAGRIAVKEVIIAEDLFGRMAGLLRRWVPRNRPVVVLMDRTPMRRCGRDAKRDFLRLLRGRCEPKVVRLGSRADPPHASLELAGRLARHLPARCVVISFGSGTITDLAKHARFLADQDAAGGQRRLFIAVPTACTVTAFSSALAVLGVAGVKRTIPSQGPEAVWIDLAMLAEAPMDLTRAGVGDLLARGIAYCDWYLSDLLGIDESYTDVPRRILADHEAQLPAIADALTRRESAAFRTLIEALLLAGYAMSVVGKTTPISGWEHVMSHYLDGVHSAMGRPLNLHGLQVAAGTFVATRAYVDVLEKLTPQHLARAAKVDLARRAAFQISRHFAGIDPDGSKRAELLRDYRPKAERWAAARDRLERLARQWPSGRIQQQLRRRLIPLEALCRAGRVLGLPSSLGQLESLASPEVAASAVRYAHLMRQRFTLGDLLSAAGWLTERRIRRWLQPAY